MRAVAVDILLKIEGLAGETPAQQDRHGLAQLVAELRRNSGGYVLTSVSHGARGPGQRSALDELRRLGVIERAATDAPAPREPAFVTLQAEGSTAGRSRPLPVLLVVADGDDFLKPDRVRLVVQQLRAAAARLDLPAASHIALGSRR